MIGMQNIVRFVISMGKSHQDNLIGTLCKDDQGLFIVLSRRPGSYCEYNLFSISDALQHVERDYIKTFDINNPQRSEHIKTYKEYYE
jgi:hypothetical protein